MVHKNKNHLETITETITDRIPQFAGVIGMTAMMAATVAATSESTIHDANRLIALIQPQPAYATAENAELDPNPEMRRSGGNREEIHNATATYGAMRRTPGVSGSI